MEMYDSIIFDLDGTLWDASEACAKGWNKALRDLKIDGYAVTPDDIRSVSGLPFHECVSTLFSGSEDLDFHQLARIIDSEEKQHVTNLGGNLYKGVTDGITQLSNETPLFLISNCQSWYLESFWNNYKLRPYFLDYDCHGSSGVSKANMIKKMCLKNSLNNPIYIGDTKGDQNSSKEAGIAFGLVEYGFGKADKPEHSFSNFAELVVWCQRLRPLSDIP